MENYNLPKLEEYAVLLTGYPIEDGRIFSIYAKSCRERDGIFGAPNIIFYWRVNDIKSKVRIAGVVREDEATGNMNLRENHKKCLERLKAEHSI